MPVISMRLASGGSGLVLVVIFSGGSHGSWGSGRLGDTGRAVPVIAMRFARSADGDGLLVVVVFRHSRSDGSWRRLGRHSRGRKGGLNGGLSWRRSGRLRDALRAVPGICIRTRSVNVWREVGSSPVIPMRLARSTGCGDGVLCPSSRSRCEKEDDKLHGEGLQ